MKARTKQIAAFLVGAALVYGLVSFAPRGTTTGAATAAVGQPVNQLVTTTGGPTPIPGAKSMPIGTVFATVKTLGNDTSLTSSQASVRVWDGSVEPSSSATGSNPLLTASPNLATAASPLQTNQMLKAVVSGPNIYPESLFGATDDGKAIAGSFPSRCEAGCDTITQPMDFPKVRFIATPNDILNEASPSGQQSLNGQSNVNGTVPWAGVGVVSSTVGATNCLAVGFDSTPANGDTVFWNNTNCGGSLFTRFDLNSGTVAYTSQFRPGLRFSDPHNGNRSSIAVSAAALSHFTSSGGQYSLGSGNVADLMNQNKCLLLYDPANPYVPANRLDTVRLDVTPSAANWGDGMAVQIDQVDLIHSEDCTGQEFWLVGNGTGQAQASAQRITLERYPSD